MLSGLTCSKLGIARRRAIHLACGDAEVPADDFHRPIGEVSELVLKEVQSRQQLAAISRKFFSERGAQAFLIGDCQIESQWGPSKIVRV